jgi:asparagine synthetase B (glutamine-hydrolysing)
MIDKIITDIIEKEAPSDDVAVLMSGGIDSMTCAFSAQRLGKTVHTYTMKVNGVDNDDNLTARLAAETYGWDHQEIDVPITNLKDDFLRLMRYYDCKKKTHVECTFPFLYVYPKIKEAHVISGVAADGWYGVSKKANMHYKHTKELFDEFRTQYFGAPNPAGILQQEQLAEEIEANLVAPYVRESVKNWMMQYDHDFFNKPFQKAPIVEAYPEFQKMPRRRRHANLQLVAGIPEYFEQLLEDKELNYRNRIRTMDLVRDYVGYEKNSLFA